MSKLIISTQETTGLSAYINPSNGEAFMTKNMIARLLKLEPIQITRIAQSKGITNNFPNGVQLLTGGGLQGVTNLVKASDLKVFIKEANKLPSSDKDHLEVVLDALIDAGATAYIYNLSGYSMQKVEPKKKSLYPDRSAEYTRLRLSLTDMIKRNGGGTYYYIKLEEAINRTAGCPQGRSGNPMTEIETYVFCIVMNTALEVALLAEAGKQCRKTILKLIDGKLATMQAEAQLIKSSMIALEAKRIPTTYTPTLTITPTVPKRTVKARKPKKDSKVLMAAVGELKMDLMPGMEGYVKPELRGTKKPPVDNKMVDCMPDFDFD